MAGQADKPPFPCVQFEYGFLLGPPDGRYLVREPGGTEVERVLVLTTLGAPPRRSLRNRKGTESQEAGPEPVPTSRATVVAAEPLDRVERAEAWLTQLRADPEALDAQLDASLAVINRALGGWRTASADPYARDVGRGGALAIRLGYGSGDAVAEGRFGKVWELPPSKGRARRSMEAPDERFAALLGGRARSLACEELVLRARADVDAGRWRESALQANVALDVLLTEIPKLADSRRAALEDLREPVQRAAEAARRSGLPAAEAEVVFTCVAALEAALRAFRLGAPI